MNTDMIDTRSLSPAPSSGRSRYPRRCSVTEETLKAIIQMSLEENKNALQQQQQDKTTLTPFRSVVGETRSLSPIPQRRKHPRVRRCSVTKYSLDKRAVISEDHLSVETAAMTPESLSPEESQRQTIDSQQKEKLPRLTLIEEQLLERTIQQQQQKPRMKSRKTRRESMERKKKMKLRQQQQQQRLEKDDDEVDSTDGGELIVGFHDRLEGVFDPNQQNDGEMIVGFEKHGRVPTDRLGNSDHNNSNHHSSVSHDSDDSNGSDDDKEWDAWSHDALERPTRLQTFLTKTLSTKSLMKSLRAEQSPKQSKRILSFAPKDASP